MQTSPSQTLHFYSIQLHLERLSDGDKTVNMQVYGISLRVFANK